MSPRSTHHRLTLIAAAAALAIAAGTAPLAAETMSEKTVNVGGAPMYPSKNIIENAANSKDHTTFVAAVNAAGLAGTFEREGPFTVFAPVNKAFDKLPKGTLESSFDLSDLPQYTSARSGAELMQAVLGQASGLKSESARPLQPRPSIVA